MTAKRKKKADEPRLYRVNMTAGNARRGDRVTLDPTDPVTVRHIKGGVYEEDEEDGEDEVTLDLSEGGGFADDPALAEALAGGAEDGSTG